MLYIFLFIIIISFLIGLAIYAIIEAINNKNNKQKNKIIIGDCISTRWGCCPDGIVPKYDIKGTNCVNLIS